MILDSLLGKLPDLSDRKGQVGWWTHLVSVPSSSLRIGAWPPGVQLREDAVAERAEEEDPSAIGKMPGLGDRGGVESGEDGDAAALQKGEDGMARVSSSSATKSVRGNSTGAMPELEAFKDENRFNRLIMHVIATRET
jgi:hypothetical protein